MSWFDSYMQHLSFAQMGELEKMIGLVCIVVIGLLVLLFLLRRIRQPAIQKKKLRQTMFGYVLIYADQTNGKRAKQENFGKVLYSETYDLRGKPDYIFRKIGSRKIVPVELKSACIGNAPVPHYGDYLQLAAYFLLLEDVYGVRPRFGFLKYQDHMFLIRNQRKMRQEVIQTMQKMRHMLSYGASEPKSNYTKCRYCICRGTVCPASKHLDGGER